MNSSTPERLSHLLVQMLNDLGVEVDSASKLRVFSRTFGLQYSCPPQMMKWRRKDEALQYLQNLLQGRDRPTASSLGRLMVIHC